MVDVRANATTGLMEVRHPDLGLWVQAIAPLLVVNGWTVSLADAQALLLRQLKESGDAMPLLLQELKDLRLQISASDNRLDDASQNQLQALTALLESIEECRELLRQAESSAEAQINGITSIHTLLASIKTSVDGLVANSSYSILSTPSIAQVALADANTEYPYNFPANTKRYCFKARADATRNDPVGAIRYSWQSNRVAASAGLGSDSYEVLPVGAEESEYAFFGVQTPIYFASNVAGVVVTIRTWR